LSNLQVVMYANKTSEGLDITALRANHFMPVIMPVGVYYASFYASIEGIRRDEKTR